MTLMQTTGMNINERLSRGSEEWLILTKHVGSTLPKEISEQTNNRERKREIQRQRQRETEKDSERQRERDRERDRQRETCSAMPGHHI